ncbi:MAG: nucleotidyltransferase family protein [Armatimonadetes bacterium]|nr:nucleotidyltransferase family protein [Anaerolineae bacterium]
MSSSVGAIVLAAGLSSRMGRSKALLPWSDNHTVIAHILTQLQQTDVAQVLVVTGAYADQVAAQAAVLGIDSVHNPEYATGEMLSSLKVGLRALPDTLTAALVVLGDQPRLEVSVVQQLLEALTQHNAGIVAPRYQGQRGHPMLISRHYWDDLLALPPGGAPRDVIQRHQTAVVWVDVDSDSVLSDMDTPEAYAAERLKAGLGYLRE